MNSFKRNMRFSKISTVYTFFILMVYVVVPFADAVACNDFNKPIRFQTREVGTDDLRLTNMDTSPSAVAQIYGKESFLQKPLKAFCQVCFNAAKIVEAHNNEISFFSIPLTFRPIIITRLGPTFPIDKPPQN